jgi:two-component system nitrogen regulation sensor histidine kinase GlnL
MLNAELRITFVNSSAESLLGASKRQLLGQRISEVFVPSEDLVAVCERTIKSGLEFRLRDYECRAWQRPLIIDCRVSPSFDGRSLLLEMNETTVERRLRQEAELIAQQKVSRRIVRQLAHEVKNPLVGMPGAAQLLQRQLDNGPLTQYTRVIIDEADRLAALVDSILKPGARLDLQEINPHEVTEHVAKLVEAEKSENVRLVRDYDPGLPPIRIDRNQLIQALLNISRNAMQAVGDSGTITIRTRAQHNVNFGQQWHRLVLCIEVEDDGPGIPPELLESIFYPLVSGGSKGTGLGLTIAQELVANHHGLIEVESEPGKTKFLVRLPFEAIANAGEETRA